ncbi:hypothetical protein B296_00013800 [Ensete ventricosum]|uniref:Uncharacterized protein n=1 Tax=Ensete ventricosum TaxID=4639 RepID=A0A427AT55_ENSVE|nr:hypothetical protein B296_00013800 [Ensete ventricosum]
MGVSVDNIRGLVLALSSSLFIGSSFIVKKKGLKRAGVHGVRAGLVFLGFASLSFPFLIDVFLSTFQVREGSHTCTSLSGGLGCLLVSSMFGFDICKNETGIVSLKDADPADNGSTLVVGKSVIVSA